MSMNLKVPVDYAPEVLNWLEGEFGRVGGAGYLGADRTPGNCSERVQQIGLAMWSAFSERHVVFGMYRGEKFIAGLKLARVAGDLLFVAQLETMLKEHRD